MRAAAALKITKSKDEIIIERSVFASRKKGRLAKVSTGKELFNRSVPKSGTSDKSGDKTSDQSTGKGELSNEAKYWRNTYMEMKREQHQEIKNVEELLKLTLDRETQLLAYARLLERKIDSIIDPLHGNQNQRDTKQSNNNNNNTESTTALSTKLEEQRKLLRLYELMTGVSVKLESANTGNANAKSSGEDMGLFLCTVKNKIQRSAIRFSLLKSLEEEKDADDDEDAMRDDGTSCQFVPLANIEKFPDYLRDAIDFEPNMGPILLSDILSCMFEEEEEEEE